MIHWGWTAATLVFTAALVAAQWVLAVWATVGMGVTDLFFWGAAAVLLMSVAVNIAWPSILALNAALIWFAVATAEGNWSADLVRALSLLVILNVMLLAIFYARRRAKG